MSLVRLLILITALNLSGCGPEDQSTTSNAGFAGLGQDADGFQHAEPNQLLTFPTDHAAHPHYRLEC